MSEVKSFSSFSFSDVALDYKDYKVYSEHEKQQTLSQSDPSQLDQARDDSPEVSGDPHPQQQQQQQQAKPQVPRLAMAQGSSSSRRQARAGFWSKSRSVDLWLREHFAGEDTAGPGREKLAGDTQHHIVFSKYPYYIHKYVINVKLTGEKKQVSIVESAEQEDCAKKRREKLQRQDTPLHPHSVR